MPETALSRAKALLSGLAKKLDFSDMKDVGDSLKEKSDAVGEVTGAKKNQPQQDEPYFGRVNPKARYGDRPGEKRPEEILGSLKKGTSRVRKTGKYKLHRDEAVLNKDEADAYRAGRDRAATLLGGKSKKSSKPTKRPHRITLREAENGGIIAEHQYRMKPGEPMEDNREYALANLDELHDHLGHHWPDEPESAAEEAAERRGDHPEGASEPDGSVA